MARPGRTASPVSLRPWPGPASTTRVGWLAGRLRPRRRRRPWRRSTTTSCYHGDLTVALRRLMAAAGFRDRQGEQVQGVRESCLGALRRYRRDRLEQYDLGGLRRRHRPAAARTSWTRSARRSTTLPARPPSPATSVARELTDEAVAERQAARPRRLICRASFASSAAVRLHVVRGGARALKSSSTSSAQQARSELVLNHMRGDVEPDPQQMQRTKDMLAELNQMPRAARRRAGARLRRLHGALRRLLPRKPPEPRRAARGDGPRMAAMQSMVNSMTPEQRAQLQGSATSCSRTWTCAGRWTSSARTSRACSRPAWNRRYDFQGQDPLGFAEAAQTMNELGDLDQLENLLRARRNPGALAEVDLDRARDLLGDDTARSLEKLSEPAQMLQEAGLIEQKEGRLELTSLPASADRSDALGELFSKAGPGQGRPARDEPHGHRPRAGLRDRAHEFGDPFNLSIERTIRNAIAARRGSRSSPPPGRASAACVRWRCGSCARR